MGFIESVLELIAPTRCAGCDEPGTLLCSACQDLLLTYRPEHACVRCAAPWGELVCTECWSRAFSFERALALGEFELPLARAVVLLKDSGERRLAPLLGTMLGEAVGARWPGWADAITWIPATRAARTRRGFDHAEEIARAAAGAVDCRVAGYLTRAEAADQRLLGRDERARNAARSFRAGASLPARIVVVDDVMTTGATLDAAAEALCAGGAESVRVAALARTW